MNIIAFVKNPTDEKYREYLGYFFRKRLPDMVDWTIDTLASRLEKPKKSPSIPIKSSRSLKPTPVDLYWSKHLVKSVPIKSAFMSKRYSARRFKTYPLFKDLMEIYSDHKGETVLDYGCGPGDDLLGFALESRAKKLIGMDVSLAALRLAQQRLRLHNIGSQRAELIHISDRIAKIPLRSSRIDYIYSEGVLHHTSNPLGILEEFYRVLKPNSVANIMIYNPESIYLHLFTAYEKMILQGKFVGLGIKEAFGRNTDGENCPIVRCYTAKEFIALGKQVGFKGKYVGGYFLDRELKCFKKYRQRALKDKRLARPHKEFLKNLVLDKGRYPLYKGKYAGIGGVYRFSKR